MSIPPASLPSGGATGAGAAPSPGRGVFCNRTLNMRQLKAIGYDMDYTLVHYDVDVWERRAYEYTQARLARMGWPVDGLQFDPGMVIRGLIPDPPRSRAAAR